MEQETHTADSIMEMIRQLPIVERVRLHSMLKEPQEKTPSLEDYLTEQRFSNGRVCPICGGTHVQRNGRRKNGTQKFICKDCGKTFSIGKNTIFKGTRKEMSVWMEYMECMAEGLSIPKSAERCGISERTSFTWRHKILDAIWESQSSIGLSGIVEADETFVPVSYKGNRTKFCDGSVERKQRTRGGENHKRGLSDELVCIPCAVDRNGNAQSRVAKLGKCSAEAVGKVFDGHIDQKSTPSYRKFSRGNGNALVQIKGGKKSIKGIYHIQHQNVFHSKLKLFLARFKGVSLKYHNNYLTWNSAVEHMAGTIKEKVAAMLRHAVSAIFEETCLALPQRPCLPVLVKNQS